MPKKLTQEQFLRLAKKTHNDKYDYSDTVYKTYAEKVIIRCPVHGEFKQQAGSHLKGFECNNCGNEKIRKTLTQDTNSFIKKAKKVHGERYDYSQADYKTSSTPVKIVCKDHGEFLQKPEHHIQGKGCQRCDKEVFNTDSFIKKSKEVHGNRYDYSKSIYTATIEVVKIKCLKHGYFFQRPSTHIKGHGCRQCNRGGYTYKKKDFLKSAQKTHGERYDYSQADYKSSRQPITIICKKHGKFEQTPEVHLSGSGCTECGRDSVREKRALNQQQFIDKSKQSHPKSRYDYSGSIYYNQNTKVDIECPVHGVFKQVPKNHISRKSGCPKCASIKSRQETELLQYIKQYYQHTVLENDRTVLPDNLELDIVLPDLKLAFEYNGWYWHSSTKKPKNYHKRKHHLAKQAGYRLIQVWEPDWVHRKDIVKGISRLAVGNPEAKVYGRKLQLIPLQASEASKFFKENHLFGGKAGGSYRIGLFDNKLLVAAMTFSKRKFHNKNTGQEDWELVRYAPKNGYAVVGGPEKLLKSFLSSNHVYPGSKLISYCDKNYFDESLYTRLGFDLERTGEEGLRFVNSNQDFESRNKYWRNYWDKNNIPYDNSITMLKNTLQLKNVKAAVYDAGSYKMSLTAM